MTIHLARPDITEREIQAVVDVLRTPNLSLGPKLPEFEARFAEYCGVKHAVAVCNGTAGLHLVVRSIGIRPGDEVITTPFSFVASANCILYEGGTPVFVDIEADTWSIDPSLVEAAVTRRTRAMIPVDVFGQPADFIRLGAIASKHGLRMIEDSCEALGARLDGRLAGTLGEAGVYGFYPNKQITTGEGGIIVTNDDDIATLCRSMRNQGRDTLGGWLDHPRMGYNYRLCDINCALGIVQLERINHIIETRTRVAKWYLERLAGEKRLTTQRIMPNVSMSWFVFVVKLTEDYTAADRDGILVALRDKGIGCSNYFVPIHLQKYMAEAGGYRRGAFPVCEAVADRTIALPFHKELTADDVDTVCRELKRLL